MTVHLRSATALLLLTAAVAACGGSSPAASTAARVPSSAAANTSGPAPTSVPTALAVPAASTAGIDACALITQPEAKALLGYDPGPGMDTGTADSPACAYDGSLTVGLELNDGKAQFDATTATMQGSETSQALSGVGDGAYVTIVANTIASMEILKGTTLLTINVQGDPSRQNITLAALTALGTTVVGRL